MANLSFDQGLRGSSRTVCPDKDFILSLKEGFELLLINAAGKIEGAGVFVDGISCSFMFSAGLAATSTIRLVGLFATGAGTVSDWLSATGAGGAPDWRALIRSLKETRSPTFGAVNVATAGVAAVDGLLLLALVDAACEGRFYC